MWLLYAAIGLTIAFILIGILILVDTDERYPSERKHKRHETGDK